MRNNQMRMISPRKRPEPPIDLGSKQFAVDSEKVEISEALNNI